MRILIDPQGTFSLSSKNRGIGRYTRALIRGLLDNRGDHEIIILLNMLFPHEVKVFKKEFKGLIPPKHFIPYWGTGETSELNPANAWNNKSSEILLEKMVEDIHPDFFLITSLFEGDRDNSVTSIGNYAHTIPTAVIFYDLIPFISPKQYLNDFMTNKWYNNKIESLKRADLLLSISQSAKEEALTYLHFDDEKIVNISSANDEAFFSIKASRNVEKKYNITRAFLMHTSAFEERKNFVDLIYAFAFLADNIRLAHQLVLVCGLKKEQRKILEDTIASLGLGTDEVILTDFVPDEDLIALYNACYLFVFPSLHEGFGLPLLEAMSCGAAVIGSNNSSIPEVIGREDALFNPYSICDISKKITEVLTNKDFHSDLKRHALVQSKKFDWNTTSMRVIKALESYTSTKSIKETPDLMDSIKKIDPHIDDNALMRVNKAIERNEKSVAAYLNNDTNNTLKWRVEGPFDSSYSLALLNRETALALTALGHDVALHSTEGPGDFEPNPLFLEAHPIIAQLHQKAKTLSQFDADVTSRNLYPPRVCDMQSKTNMLHHYAWEESAFPQKWVDNFNLCLTGMTCLSSHVEKIMIDNGVTTPMLTSGCGVDHWERIVPDKTYQITARDFRFLHVSSCFPRKGADILLKAYAETFTDQDHVSLLIKTFPNPHNEIHQWLDEAKKRHQNFPHVIIIEEDLTDAQLKSLYEQCHALVAPSRAEGFGLPMAEAMLSGLPVITTGWGGQVDFCHDNTSWLIDYTFTPAHTHFELFDSVWAEPSQEHLEKLMREVYELPLDLRLEKSKNGRKLLLENFKWTDVAERLVSASQIFKSPNESTLPKIGWITTWNTKCGIAAYSEHIVNAFTQDVTILANHADLLTGKDTSNVHRCWQTGDGNRLNTLSETIEKLKLDTIIIQFNYSFFDFKHFNDFLKKQIGRGKTIVLMLHATIDSTTTPHKQLSMLSDTFKQCDRLLVHTPNDLNRLKYYNLVDNVTLFPHGIVDWKNEKQKKDDTFTLATYGFFLPHKGLMEIVNTFNLLLNQKSNLKLKLKMINAEYPVALSTELIAEVEQYIDALGLSSHIELITDFLPDEESLTLLSRADLIVFPYQETGESSSAAVRYGLATHRPVAVTPLSIFDDVGDAVFKLPGTSANDMADGIEKIITEIQTNSELAVSTQEKSQRWVEAHHYANISQRLFQMIEALHQKR